MPEQTQWNPSLDANQTRKYVNDFQDDKSRYSQQDLETLRNHAQYHNVPFYEGDFSIMEAMEQFGGGLIEGFSTLNLLDDPPDNTYEAIARNLGHLAGFAPGILAKPLQMAGIATKSKALMGAAKTLGGVKSVPFYLTEKFIAPKARSIFGSVLKSNIGSRNKIFNTTKQFLLGEQAKSVMEGAFNLGTASAISSWQHGVDAMMSSYFHGAIAGGVFRSIGNVIGKNVKGGKQFPVNVESKKAEGFARALAGSLFMGVPSTMRGATTPEQIYEYLMGAYFGGSEKPWTVHKASKIYSEKVLKSKDIVVRKTKDAERALGEEWKTLEPEVQIELQRMGIRDAGGTPDEISAAQYQIVERFGEMDRIPKDSNLEKNVFKTAEEINSNIVKTIIKETIGTVKEVPKITKKERQLKDREQIHVLTSGEEGLPSFFTREAEKRGITTVQVLSPVQKQVFGRGKLTEQIQLKREALGKANKAINKAVKDLGSDISNLTEYSREGIRRDYNKVKYAQEVFVFDKVSNNLKSAAGPSKYAVQMAINLEKPTYLFDKNLNTWLKYNPTKKSFDTFTTIPELPQRYAVLGQKVISKQERAAINKLFQKYDKMGFKEEYELKRKKMADTLKEESEMPDTGERIVTPLDNKMAYMFSRYFSKELKKDLKTNDKVNIKLEDYAEKAGKIAEDFIEEGSLKNRSEEWANTVEKELKIKLSPEIRGDMRKFITVQQQGKPVRMITTDGTDVNITDPNLPYTLAGKKKLIVEPAKELELVYNEITGKETPKEGVYALLDHVTHKGRDIELSRLISHIRDVDKIPFEQAKKFKESALSNIIKKMKNKYNMHPYSGNGDKDRIVFVKYHPNYKKVNVKNLYSNAYKFDSKLFNVSRKEWENIVKSNMAYDMSLNGKESIKDVIGDGYIDNAVAFNKRSQIWMTGGWRGDKEFIKKHGGLKLTENGDFRGSMIDDPKKVANILKELNINIPESFDGAILAIEKAVDIQNRDAGHPYSGQNKSFLVLRDPNNGTMLGKYMVHKVHPKMSKMMESYDNGKGIHFLMMKSAIKQKGDRGLKPGSYDLEGNKLNLHGDAKNIIDIDPSAFRYNHSVFQDQGMLGENSSGKYIGVRVPKQMMILPNKNADSPIKQEVIDKYYEELSQKSYDGKVEFNNLIESWRTEVSPEKKERFYEEILDNFENLGVEKVFETLKTPGEEKLAQEFLLKILKTNKDAIESLSSAAEISGSSLDGEIKGVLDFHGTADVLIKNAAALKEEAFPIFFDKYTEPYIEKALRGFVADKVFKPRAENSLTARMRPYDVYMQKKFPELNTRDDIFYLGDLFKPLEIRTVIEGYEKTTLGKLWDAYKGFSAENKALAEDVFEAISVRVPQDSMSGAQVVKFKGFTGIKDHGVLQHGRVLRAEGGADLDADESSLFFGGQSESGVGHGMRKSFKDMFKSQKNEYVDASGKIPNVKEMFARDLLLSPLELKNEGIPPEVINIMQGKDKTHPYSKYYPGVRLYAGEKAAEGRNTFSAIVAMTQNMRAAWNATLDAPGKSEILRIEKADDYMLRTIRIAKPSSKKQRLLTAGLTAFGADPMDMTGLKSYNKLKGILEESYFETKKEIFDNKKGKWRSLTSWDKTPRNNPILAKKIQTTNFASTYDKIKDFNSAFFGRDWKNNSKWTSKQVANMIAPIKEFESEQINTALPKFAKTVEKLDMDVNIFNRIDPESVNNLYNKTNEGTKKLKYLKNLLGRSTLWTPDSDVIKFVANEGVFSKTKLNLMASRPTETLKKLKEYGIEPIFEEGVTYETMKSYLENLTKDAHRFLVDDIHDMTTLELVNDKISSDRKVLTDDLVKDISEKVEGFKNISSLNQYERNSKGLGFQNETLKEKEFNRKIRKMHIALTGTSFIKDPVLAKRTKLLDMGQLDSMIEQYKAKLPSKSARDLFDYLMIGSLRHRNIVDRLEKVLKQSKISRKSDFYKTLKDNVYFDGAKTSTTKLAYDSKATDPLNIQKFLSAKNKYFKKTMEEFTPEDTKEMENFKKEVNAIAPEETIFKEKAPPVDISGYEGIRKGKLNKEQLDIISKLELNLRNLPDFVKGDLNQSIAGIYSKLDPLSPVTKNLNQMNIEDFNRINRWIEANQGGTIFQSFEKKLKEIERAALKDRHYMMMPGAINREMMSRDVIWAKKRLFFFTEEGMDSGKPIVEKYVRYPTYYGDVLRNGTGKWQDLEHGISEAYTLDFSSRFAFLDQIKDGRALYDLSQLRYELDGNRKESPIYKENWKSHSKEHNWRKLKNKKYVLDIAGKGKKEEATGEEIFNEITKRYDEFMNKKHELIVGKPGALDKYITGFYDKGSIKNPPRNPILDYKSFLNKIHQAMRKGNDAELLSALDIGMDGIRHMTRSMVIDLLPVTEYVGVSGKYSGKKISPDEFFKLSMINKKKFKPDKEAIAKKYEDLDIKSTGFRKGFVPHYFLSKKRFKKAEESEYKFLENKKKSMSKEEYKKAKQDIWLKYRFKNGDWDSSEMYMVDIMDADLFKDTLKDAAKSASTRQAQSLKMPKINQMFNNMHSRTLHSGGYIVGPEATHLYLRNLSRTAFRQLNNLTSRYTLHQMRKRLYKTMIKGNKKERKEGRKHANAWVNFWTLYAKRAMGMPSVINKALYENPDMKLNTNPYGWWADNRFADWVNNAFKKLGLAKKVPENLTKDFSKKELKELESLIGFNAYDAQRWSNLEGQFELATLMTHPKTPINNIFGGTMHTFQSVGYQPLKKARTLQELQKINPKWKSMNDVFNFVEELGVIPELTLHQFGMEKQFQGGRVKEFVTELSSQAAGIKELRSVDIVALAEKHGIAKSVMNVAAKFMSIPERMLRRDAFMAHYIKAWERLGGAIKNPANPILVEIAKKGVKATQFLYNAAERPAFAATAFGKIFSRFQLWSWNAVKFRNDVRKQASLYGFKPGTEAMRRFERTIQADMFILALGSVFMYSLFGQVIPAPYNWLQDTAEWVFGDEDSRNRAFFGTWPKAVAPLQLITPPIARLPISVIREFAEDDYNKLADYYMWTMFPFGRMLRDVAGPKNMVENPMRIPEKVFGFPLTGLSKEAKRIKKGESYKPPTPGGSLY